MGTRAQPTILPSELICSSALENVQIEDGNLVLIQRAYSEEDAEARNAVGVAGIQSKTLDILHGTFRTTMKIEGANGGSVASFF